MTEDAITARVRWHTLLEALPVPVDEARPLHDGFDRLEPGEGLRAMFAAALSSLVDDHAVADYRAFKEQVPVASRFGFMSLGDISLLHARAATLREPGVPILESINRQTCSMVARGDRASLLGRLISMAEGSVERFLDGWMAPQAVNLLENFGHRSLDGLAPGRARVIYERHHTAIAAHYVPGQYRGLLDWFEVESEVAFEALDERRFVLDLRWTT